MDGKFFRFHLPEWQKPESQQRIFTLAYNHFVALAQQVHPEQYVTGDAWRTSRTKIIDNALIGFCKAELGDQPLVADNSANGFPSRWPGFHPLRVRQSPCSAQVTTMRRGYACSWRRPGKRSKSKHSRPFRMALSRSTWYAAARLKVTRPTQPTFSAASPMCWKTSHTEGHSEHLEALAQGVALRERSTGQTGQLPRGSG